MSEERRNHERVLLPLEVRWEGQSGRHTARISDISLGGCFIESLGQVSDGERIRFQIQMPTGNWMPLSGLVVYSYPNIGFGVRFREVSEAERDLLAGVIEYGK
ncbi:MAG: PilZ domain-containing protein [Acidobacteria bacterium]|nr:PilZ domain-containing protein [Acidobacteriota bacterium]